jgi:hypothetical protein
MGKHQHQCKMCGKSFENYFEVALFCSKDCNKAYRKENSKCKNIICPICNTEFKQKHAKQIFCSVECRIKATENKQKCTCDYCGKLFYRKESEVIKSKHHYCSEECKRHGMYWSDEDIELLVKNFNMMTCKEMVNIFSKPKTVREIERKAISIGLTESKKWSQEEIDILIKNYSSSSIQNVMSLLPNRTLLAIRGQAKVQNLKSFYYLSRLYTNDENEYLKNNYLNKSDEELALYLSREVGAVKQHLWVLGLKRPYCLDNYTNIAEYVRSRLYEWKNHVRKQSNYTCAITGEHSNLVIHHIYGFNLLLAEAIDNIEFPIYDNMSEYSDEKLDELVEEFLSLQEYYGQYICISENVHKHFHSIYGCGNNTKQQWDEFVNTHYNK